MVTENPQLQEWFQNSPGKFLLEAEMKAIHKVLPRLYGFHLLQIGGPVDLVTDSPCRIAHRVHLTSHPRADFLTQSQVIADVAGLPFLPDSIDVVILPHVLEFLAEPQATLHECYQILAPDGHVIILGFQPVSWGGALHWLKRKPFGMTDHFLSSWRIRSWLQQAGFSIKVQSNLFFRPLLKNESYMQKLLFLEAVGQLLWPSFGTTYLIVAQKMVAPLIPWRSYNQARPLVPGKVCEATPMARSRCTDE